MKTSISKPSQHKEENNEARQQKGKSTATTMVDNRPEAAAQAKLINTIQGTAQRKETGDEEELDGKSTQLKANKTGMPDGLKSGLENLSGMSMDHVNVHYNSPQPAQLNAHAFTQGSDIHVASGQEKHVAHEGWHVVQQAQGRVQPTMQMAGTQINDDAGLEKEADVMGGKALSVGQRVAQRVEGWDGNERAHMYPIQMVLNSAVNGGAAATLANPALAAHINANSSAIVQGIVNDPNIFVNVIWDGALGQPAITFMNIRWNDGAGHGPHDLFNTGNIALVSAINFNALVNHRIDIEIHLQTHPAAVPPGTTWQGNLLHELEAHTRLAEKVEKIVSSGVRDRRKRANVPSKIATTMNARDEDREHASYAYGSAGSEGAMTNTVISAPRNEQIGVLLDIGGDRLDQLQDSHNNTPIDRMTFNATIARIVLWLKIVKSRILHLTGVEEGQINALITNVNGSKI